MGKMFLQLEQQKQLLLLLLLLQQQQKQQWFHLWQSQVCVWIPVTYDLNRENYTHSLFFQLVNGQNGRIAVWHVEQECVQE